MKRTISAAAVVAMTLTPVSVAFAAVQSTAAPSATTAATAASVWMVKSGDTLWKIARNTGVPVAVLADYNHLTNPNLLRVGQEIQIPSTWTVRPGDMLWKIAQATGSTVQGIVQANHIANPDRIQSGTVLIIPAATGTSNTGSSTGGATYTVKAGDTLWKIAMATGVTVQALVQANGLTNPDQLAVGQVLKIPAKDATGSTTATHLASLSITMDNAAIVENSSSVAHVTVKAVNQDGSPASGITLTPQLTANVVLNGVTYPIASIVEQAPIVTDAQGNAAFTIASNGFDIGAFTVSVSADGVSSNTLSGSIVRGVDAAHSAVTSMPSTMMLDRPYVVDVTAKDANGNPLVGLTKSAFYLQIGNNAASTQSVSELGNGQYSVTFLAGGAQEDIPTGQQPITLRVNDVIVSGAGQTVNVVPDAPVTSSSPQYTISLLTQPHNVEEGGNESFEFQIKDNKGNPVPNLKVFFQNSNPNLDWFGPRATYDANGIPTPIETTDQNGDIWADLKPTGGTPQTGSMNLTVNVDNGTPLTIPIQVVNPIATVNLSVATTNLKVGDTETVDVTALDANGQPIPDVQLVIGTNDGAVAPPVSPVFTDSNGHAQFTVTATRVGEGTISVGDYQVSKSLNFTVSQ